MKSGPSEYEITTIAKAGLKVLIRPIEPEDAPLLEELFQTLSQRSVYFRFFVYLKALPQEMLARLTEIDHNRNVVLVATESLRARERVLGVFRLMCDPERKKGEFALVVGDPWQGKGIGAELFQQGLSIARGRGVELVWGMALAENKTMLALASKLGFTIKWDSESRAYDLRMDLKSSAGEKAGHKRRT